MNLIRSGAEQFGLLSLRLVTSSSTRHTNTAASVTAPPVEGVGRVADHSATVSHTSLAPIVLAAIVSGYASVRALWPYLAERGFAYDDLVVGYSTVTGTNKGRDFAAFWAFLIISSAVAVFLGGLGRCLARRGGDDVRTGYGTLLWVGLIPAAARLGMVLTGVAPLGPMFESCVGIGLVVAASGLLLRWRQGITKSDVTTLGGAMLAAVLFGGMAAGGVLTAGYRLLYIGQHTLDTHTSKHWLAAGAAAGAGGIVLACLTAATPAAARRRACGCIVACQAGLPFLFASLLSSPILTDPRIPLTTNRPETGVLVVIGGLMVACWFDLVRRARVLYRAGDWSLPSVLSPGCLAAVVFFFAVVPDTIPVLGADLFHEGEMQVPGQQVFDFGKLPYRDFSPIFGAAVESAVVNDLVFSGTEETRLRVELAAAAVGVCLLFLAVWWYTGPWQAILVGLFGGTWIGHRNMFWLPAVIVLAHPWLLARPGVWLAAWAVACPVLAFTNPTTGCTTVIATLPVAGAMTVALLRRGRAERTLIGAAVLAGGGLVAAVAPVREVAFGYVRFLASQAGANGPAWGIPWDVGTGVPGSHGIFATPAYEAWEVFRFAWIPVATALIYLAWTELRTPPGQRDLSRLVLAATLAVSVIAMHGHSLGRISPGDITRAGRVTIPFVTVWLAVVVFRRSPAGWAVNAALFAVLLGGMKWPYSEPSVAATVARITHIRSTMPEHLSGAVLVPPDELLTPHLGRVYADPEFLAHLRSFQTEIEQILQPDETFLNMTTNNGWYFYTHRPVPGHLSSAFYAAGADDQLRMVRTFREVAPPVAVLRPSTDFDLSPVNLRCYRLFREVALAYVPVRRGEFLFLVDPSRVGEGDPNEVADRIALLNEAYPESNLRRLPGVWGKSWDGLKHRYTRVARLDDRRVPDGPLSQPESGWNIPGKHGNGASFDLTGLDATGADADFIRLDFDWQLPAWQPFPDEASVRVEFKTADDADWQFAARFQVSDSGRVLIPLGSRPNWLLSDSLSRVRFAVENFQETGPFRVSKVQLLKLTDGQ